MPTPNPVKWNSSESLVNRLRSVVPFLPLPPPALIPNEDEAKEREKSTLQKGIDDIKVSLSVMKIGFENVFSKIEVFSGLLTGNPIVAFFSTMNKLIQKAIQDFLSMGAQVILIHPLNRMNKRTMSLTNERSKVVAAAESIPVFNAFATAGLEALERHLDRETDLDDFPYPEIPVMTPVEAFEELKASFKNENDPHRPRWSSATTAAGFGILVASPSGQTGSFIEILKVLGKFLDEMSSSSLQGYVEKLQNVSAQYRDSLISSGLISKRYKDEDIVVSPITLLTNSEQRVELLKNLSSTLTADIPRAQAAALRVRDAELRADQAWRNSEARKDESRSGASDRGRGDEEVKNLLERRSAELAPRAMPIAIGTGVDRGDRYVWSPSLPPAWPLPPIVIYYNPKTLEEYESSLALASKYALYSVMDRIVPPLAVGDDTLAREARRIRGSYSKPADAATQNVAERPLTVKATSLVHSLADELQASLAEQKFFQMQPKTASRLHWYGINVNNITYLKEVANSLTALSNATKLESLGLVDVARDFLKAIITKVEKFLKVIEDVIAAVESVKMLTVSMPGIYWFTIAPQTGGVDQMIASLNSYANDTSATSTVDADGRLVQPVSKVLQAPLSALFFAAAGGLAASYFEDLFNQIERAAKKLTGAFAIAKNIELSPELTEDKLIPPKTLSHRVFIKQEDDEEVNTHFYYQLTDKLSSQIIVETDFSDRLSISSSALTIAHRENSMAIALNKIADDNTPAGGIKQAGATSPYKLRVFSYKVVTEDGVDYEENTQHRDFHFKVSRDGYLPYPSFDLHNLKAVPPTYYADPNKDSYNYQLYPTLYFKNTSVFIDSPEPFIKFSYEISCEAQDPMGKISASSVVASGIQNSNTSITSSMHLNMSKVNVDGVYTIKYTATNVAGDSYTRTGKFILTYKVSSPTVAIGDDGDISGFLSGYTGLVTIVNLTSGLPVATGYSLNGVGGLSVGTLPPGLYGIDLNGVRGSIKLSSGIDVVKIDSLLKRYVYVDKFPVNIQFTELVGSSLRILIKGTWNYVSLAYTTLTEEETTYSCIANTPAGWTSMRDVTIKLRPPATGICESLS